MAKNKSNKHNRTDSKQSPSIPTSTPKETTEKVAHQTTKLTTELKRMTWKEFYESATSFIYKSVDTRPGQTQAWWDYVRFYNGTAVMFPEKCAEIVIFERKVIERSGASSDEYFTIPNTEENRRKYLLEAFPTEYGDEVQEQEAEIEVGVGIADDPTIGVDKEPIVDINSPHGSGLGELPGATVNPNAGKQYPPIETEVAPSHIDVNQLTKDGIPSSL